LVAVNRVMVTDRSYMGAGGGKVHLLVPGAKLNLDKIFTSGMSLDLSWGFHVAASRAVELD